MAPSEATMIEAGGRDLRVSSSDRVIFPESERSGPITKLDIVKYYVAVEDGIMRALGGGRPPSSAGRRACTRASSSRPARRAAATPSSRSASRVEPRTTWRPRGSSSRRAGTPDEICPTEWPWSAGRPRWARSPSIPGRCAARTSITRTSCASTWTRSRAPTSPTPCASPPRRACSSTSSATPASRRPRAAEACTSTSGSSHAGRSRTSATPRSPSGASSSGGCPAR